MPLKLFLRGKVWHFSGSVAGRRLRKSTGTSDKVRAQRIAAEAEAREWKRHLDGPGATLTFAAAAIAYRESGRPTRFLTKVEDYWKDTLVSQITPHAIRQGAMKVYPKAGPATRNRQFIVPTQAIINNAADQGWCHTIKVKRFSVTTREKEPITMDWALKFQEHALPHLGALCLFMLTTGARISEAVNLRWQDVNLDTREAKIRQTKIGSERIANIPRVALAAIKAIPSNRAPDDRVFKYSDRTCVRQSWKSAVERAGLKYLSPHSCRHGFATKMLQDGIDVKTVAQMGGWKDVATLVRTYAHALNDHRITDSVFDTEVAHNHPKKTASN